MLSDIDVSGERNSAGLVCALVSVYSLTGSVLVLVLD